MNKWTNWLHIRGRIKPYFMAMQSKYLKNTFFQREPNPSRKGIDSMESILNLEGKSGAFLFQRERKPYFFCSDGLRWTPLWVRPLQSEFSLVSFTVLVDLQEQFLCVMLVCFGSFSPGCFPVLLDLFDNPGITWITAFAISTSSDSYSHHRVFVYHYCSYHLGTLIDYHV